MRVEEEWFAAELWGVLGGGEGLDHGDAWAMKERNRKIEILEITFFP